MTRDVRAWVELIHHLDAEAWPQRNAADEVPNATPFGIDELELHGVDVTFRAPLRGRLPGRAARAVRNRADNVEWLEALRAFPLSDRRTADVVLCWDEFTGIPAAWLSTMGGPPVVSGVQMLTDPDGWSARFLRAARGGLERCRGVFVQSRAMLPVMREQWGVPEKNLYFVPMGIDHTWFLPAETGVDPDRVVSVGDDKHRDYDTLIRAVERVREARPATRLEVATHQDVTVRPETGTVYRGHLGPRRRQVYGEAALVAVATSPNVHGSGMSVILEAMACGRPYVVTASAGLEGYVRDGHDGLVVPPGDSEALASAIFELLSDPDRADELGAAGRRRIERELTTSCQARLLAEVLRTSTAAG